MSLPEIEFELSALQYELMGYPGLTQGQSLTLTLDAGVLLPESTADSWFTVQQAALPLQLQHVGPAQYAFAGQIVAAELFKQDGADTGVVVVNCGAAPVRVTCGPREDGLSAVGHLGNALLDRFWPAARDRGRSLYDDRGPAHRGHDLAFAPAGVDARGPIVRSMA